MVKPLYNVMFWKVGYPNIFFQEICFSGGKQTIHKVSVAFIVKNWNPRTSLLKVRKVAVYRFLISFPVPELLGF